MSRKTTLERFEAKFEPCPITGCWLWNASTVHGGYGQFGYKGTMRRAHRVAYMLYVGEIPEGLQVLHKCDVPWCVNPDHFFIGTNTDNMRDKTSKGRGYTPKLTSEQALQIYHRVHAGERQQALAVEYRISRSMVSHIKKGINWAHTTQASS